jgi:hypothetical protein
VPLEYISKHIYHRIITSQRLYDKIRRENETENAPFIPEWYGNWKEYWAIFKTVFLKSVDRKGRPIYLNIFTPKFHICQDCALYCYLTILLYTITTFIRHSF